MDEIGIRDVAHRGDGVGEDGTFVPYTLPGERVRIDRLDDANRLVEVLAPSPDRVAPPCPHFGTCGGCSLQHWAPAPYLDWKRRQVETALAQAGLRTSIDETQGVARHSRRRVVMTAQPTPQGIRLGFRARASHDLVDIETCVVATQRIAKRLTVLRAILARLRLKREARVTVLDTPGGLDIAVEGARPPQSGPALARMTEICRQGHIIRVTVEGETLISFAEPMLSHSDAVTFPPPGGFVQAVAEAEEAMAARVLDIVGKARDVVELHAGIGTFTLRLARTARVSAYESDGPAVEALRRALAANKGIKKSTATRRDLDQAPLSTDELRRADAVVLDPPRAGAAAQMPNLAASAVSRIAYVSCSPASFARDARLLVDGGFQLARVTPIDQFLWSHHVELVGAFERTRG